ncbi:DUF2345 domain-containing protein, partial [Collimonas humicola]|uniref:DUF2345 domain-containing protein n=1 Tax=Collimonas humicola TaxID=2825886 RepID=UPI001B8B1E80
GMLITTEARSNASSHIKDMGETVQRLTAARDQHESLADAAQQAGAQEKQGQQADVAQTLKAQNDAIKGQGASEEGSFPELSQPHLVLASPAGIETTTAQSTHIASDEHTAITTGKSLSIASGDSWFASIRNTFRLFVQKTGIKMVAAAGDIDVQALTDSINILAKLNITQTANRITITAKEEVMVNGGGSYAKFNTGGIEYGTSGAYVAHAAMHSLPGAKNLPVPSMTLPVVEMKQDEAHRYVQTFDITTLVDYAPMAAVLQGQPYRIYLPDESLVQQGSVSEATAQVRTEKSTKVRCEIGAGDWKVHENGYDHDNKQNDNHQGTA